LYYYKRATYECLTAIDYNNINMDQQGGNDMSAGGTQLKLAGARIRAIDANLLGG
jgi:hypothetical protein